MAPDGSIAFDDFASAAVDGDDFYPKRDDASVIVQTALAMGNERAAAAALAGLGKERLADVIPLVQPAALRRGVTKGEKKLGKTLKELRHLWPRPPRSRTSRRSRSSASTGRTSAS